MKSWNVYVNGHGYIGTVDECNEGAARCAALSKYGEPGDRPAFGDDDGSDHIYDDDSFVVNPA